MFRTLLLVFLLQDVALPPRSALEKTSVLTPVPKKLQKDYDKLWQRFTTGKEDAKVIKDADKVLKKNPNVPALILLEAYIDLYGGLTDQAEVKFERVLVDSPGNALALSYLADFAFGRQDYTRAHDLYSRLLIADPTRTDVEPKLQKALLVATESLLRGASTAEQANRLADAELLYRQALDIAPHEPSLHEKLGGLLGKQDKWEQSLAEFQKEKEFSAFPDEADRRIAEALAHLGRTEEARELLDRLRRFGNVDGELESKINELENIGRWGQDIKIFHDIQSAPELTRVQTAAMILRYFPQVAEFRQTPQIITDIQDSWARPEIQTVVGIGLLDLRPNHTFEPSAPITRGELAALLSRLTRVLGVSASGAPPISTADVGPRNALYRDIQLVLGFGLMTVDDAGSFNSNGRVSGEDGVRAVEHLLAASRGIFQHVAR